MDISGTVVPLTLLGLMVYVGLGILIMMTCVKDHNQIPNEKVMGYILLWPVVVTLYVARSIRGAWKN